MAGSIKKLTIAGLPIALTSDTDASFVPGGRVITEGQINTKGKIFITDDSVGMLGGLVGQWEIGGVDQTNFDALKEQCADDPTVGLPCAITFADNSTWVATGVNIVLTGGTDSQITSREGKTEFELHCISGKFTKA